MIDIILAVVHSTKFMEPVKHGNLIPLMVDISNQLAPVLDYRYLVKEDDNIVITP